MQLVGVTPSKAQNDGVAFLMERDGGCLLYATGTGKTVIQIMTAMQAIETGKVNKFIIVATVSSFIEIKNDFKKFTDVKPFLIEDVEGLAEFAKNDSPIGIAVYSRLMAMVSINRKPAAGLSLEGRRALEALFRNKVGFTFDEVHTLKNPKAQVTQFYKMLRPYMTVCYGLTATAIMSELMDLYHTLSFCKPGCLGSKNKFSNHYIVWRERQFQNGRTVREPAKYINLDELGQEVDKVALRYYPDRDIDFQLIKAPMSEGTRQRYYEAAEGVLEEIAKDKQAAYEAYCKGGEDGLAVKSYSARMVDLQYVVNDDPNKKNAYLGYLKEHIEQGVLTFCAFHETVGVVESVLSDCKGIEVRTITGKQDEEERRENKEWFCANPRNKVLIITRAGGQSLNLQATPNMIFYDIPFGAGQATQIFGRVVREYSSFKSFSIAFLAVEDTIDQYKYDMLAANKELFMKVLSNSVMPKSQILQTYNKAIIDRLRRSLLWKN